MKCGYNYQCQYKDGFKDFYNNKVRKADIIILAGEMKDRYLSSKWKTFFDRAFFWNHTPSLAGKQIGYIISGPLSQNANLVQILEATVTARQTANLIDIVTDESNNSHEIDVLLYNMAEQSVGFAEKGFVRPDNFLGVGGHIVFRDNVWGRLRGVWQADHRYYKKHGWYDFPQKKYGMRIMNSILILACKIPYVRNKYYGNIKKFPSIRFGKLVDKILSNQT
jgi:multimeric flavodoxin WrbA